MGISRIIICNSFFKFSVGDKPIFQCELCPTTCGRKTDLRIHVQKLHTSDKPLKCKRCGKSFPDRYSYKVNTIFFINLFYCFWCLYFYLIFSVIVRYIKNYFFICFYRVVVVVKVRTFQEQKIGSWFIWISFHCS